MTPSSRSVCACTPGACVPVTPSELHLLARLVPRSRTSGVTKQGGGEGELNVREPRHEREGMLSTFFERDFRARHLDRFRAEGTVRAGTVALLEVPVPELVATSVREAVAEEADVPELDEVRLHVVALQQEAAEDDHRHHRGDEDRLRGLRVAREHAEQQPERLALAREQQGRAEHPQVVAGEPDHKGRAGSRTRSSRPPARAASRRGCRRTRPTARSTRSCTRAG